MKLLLLSDHLSPFFLMAGYSLDDEQENYSMFLVTCYTEGFIEIKKFKII